MTPSTLQLGPVAVDLGARVAWRSGAATPLTGLEARLLQYLVECAPGVATREGLLSEVWGTTPDSRSQAVGQAIRRLRVKIELDPSRPRYLLSESGVGYRLVLHEARSPSPDTVQLVERDSFVGRSAELAALEDWATSGFRLISIVGFGGMGKTRLARTFLHQYQPSGAFVPLTEARSGADVTHAVAQALRIPASELDGTGAPVGRHLATSPGLVVLDGVEQVLTDAAGLVDQWLDQAPQAVFVVTSRAPLRVSGERLVRLGSLTSDEARQLWQDRVPMGVPGPSDADTDIDRLIQRLDGIPLAIELAAARRSFASAHALHDLLSTVLRDGQSSATAGRHATLRACVDWSWRLLSDDERAALAQFAVFRGGASLDAARAVVTLPDRPDVWGVLQSLVEQSMLTCRDAHGQLRLDLLDTVREYLAEVAPVDPGARDRHLRFFAEAHRRMASGNDDADVTARASQDLPNLYAALDHAVDTASDELRCALSVSLVAIQSFQRPTEAERLVDEALAAPGGSEADRHVLTLFKAGLRNVRFDIDGALHQLSGLLEADLDPEIRGRALIELGNVAYRKGELTEARSRYAEAVELLSDRGTTFFGRAIDNLAVVHTALGDPMAAEAAHERALEINHRLGSKLAEAASAGNLAMVVFRRGAVDRAHELATRALRLSRDVVSVHNIVIETARLAWIRLHGSSFGPWQDLAEESVRLSDEVGDPRWCAESRIVMATGFLYESRPEEAHTMVCDASRYAETTRVPLLVMRSLRARAHLAMLRGQTDRASEAITRALALLPDTVDPGEPASLLALRAELLARSGDPEEGRRWLREATERGGGCTARPDVMRRLRSAEQALADAG